MWEYAAINFKVHVCILHASIDGEAPGPGAMVSTAGVVGYLGR
jgi:hypothetical protein